MTIRKSLYIKSITLVVCQGEERTVTNPALAELWFDGRTVDRIARELGHVLGYGSPFFWTAQAVQII